MNYTDIRKKTKEDTWAQDVKHKQGSTNIRAAARRDYRNHNVKDYMERCWVCGKEGKTEIMHLKASSEFRPEALVGEINHPANIVCGCGTCHTLFDRPQFKNIDWYLHKREVLLAGMEYAGYPENGDLYNYYEEFEAPIDLGHELRKVQSNIASLKSWYDADGGTSALDEYVGTKASNKKLAKLRAMTMREALVEPIGGSRYADIRAHAREECHKHKVPRECSVVGCNIKVVEVAHLVSIPEWGNDAPLGIINHIDNIRPLCRNHNTMFDKYKEHNIEEYSNFLDKLEEGWKDLDIKYKPIGGVKYVYNKMNPSNYTVLQPKDIGKEKGFWE